MDDLTHVVVTRLNITRGRDKVWTRKRIDLLLKYCAPSVFAQTHLRFTWIVLVDASTPAGLQSEILTRLIDTQPVRDDMSLIIVPMVSDDWGHSLGEWCKSNVQSKWVATTRIDSDDAFHPDYLKDIDEVVQPKTELLTFTGGYIFQLPERTTHHFPRTDTNFQTLVEPTAEAVGAHCEQHGKMKARFPFRVIEKYPRWLVVRHDNNWHYNRKKKGACPLPQAPVGALDSCFGFLNL